MSAPVIFKTNQDAEMGRVTTPVVIENYLDYELAEAGSLPRESVRRVEVPDALVDTGATAFCLPPSLIQQLGLRPTGTRPARTAGGLLQLMTYSGVRLSIQDRDTVVFVTELPEGAPVLIGQVPLEDMDLVVYPKDQKLIPNPAHGGQWTIEVYAEVP